jgi:hypothetical protein
MVRKIFMGTFSSKTHEHELEVEITRDNEISIYIESDGLQYIMLDIETAEELAIQINSLIHKIRCNGHVSVK